MAEPERETIWRAQRGDRDAQAELIRAEQGYVYSIAMSMLRDPTDAADATQEAFIRMLRALPSYRFETKFSTWLYRLVVNLCVDELRRRGRRAVSLDATAEDEPSLDPPDDDRWSDPVEVADQREMAGQVRAALSTLPVGQRLALTMHYFENMRYEDIAAALGLPLNTVKSHIHRGKERLARLLAEDGHPVPGGAEEATCAVTS